MTPLRIAALLLAALFAVLMTLSLARAQSPKGDAATGATMHDKDCVTCHVRRVGGDGSAMYTRAERRVTSSAKLRAQVSVCNAELNTGYFPDEEEHVAAYLNLRFYKFKE